MQWNVGLTQIVVNMKRLSWPNLAPPWVLFTFAVFFSCLWSRIFVRDFQILPNPCLSSKPELLTEQQVIEFWLQEMEYSAVSDLNPTMIAEQTFDIILQQVKTPTSTSSYNCLHFQQTFHWRGLLLKIKREFLFPLRLSSPVAELCRLVRSA